MIPSENPKDAIIAHIPAMRIFARTLTRNITSADDLVQDTLIKAWKNFDHFTAGSNLQAWLFRILRNTFYSDRRRMKYEIPDPDGFFARQLAEKPHHDGRLALRDFTRAFVQLPTEHREVLILVGASGMSYEEAAQTCGVAVGTIKSRVNRARTRIAAMLAIAENEPLEMTDKAVLAIVMADIKMMSDTRMG